MSAVRSVLRGGQAPDACARERADLVAGVSLRLLPRQPRYLRLSPQEDQAPAGALMMAESSVVLTVAPVALFVRTLAESERDEQRAERFALWEPG